MSAKTYLIVGVDGLVGGAMARKLADENVAVLTTAKPGSAAKADIPLDLADPSLTRLSLPQVDVTLLCASFNGFARCREHPDRARQVNVEGSELLARRLLRAGSRVVYLSSSAVFDFSTPKVLSSAPYSARTVYGASKADGERRVLALGSGVTVVRLTKILQRGMPLFAAWQRDLCAGHSVKAFADLRFCPISLQFATRAISAVIEGGDDGIYQISGASDISYAEAARHIAKRLDVPETRVIDDLAISNGMLQEEIAAHTSMDTSRYQDMTGEQPPDPFGVLDCVCGLSPAKV
jgi:dTDP-4-dehydrorhamnose reductase